MFTPPPSPNPPRASAKGSVQVQEQAAIYSPPTSPSPSASSKRNFKRVSPPLASPTDQLHGEEKRRIGRRFRFAVLLVPLVLIAITATARILTQGQSHINLGSISSSLWQHSLLIEKQPMRNHSIHKRSPQAPAESGNSSPSSSSSASNSGARSSAVPTVPDVPPALPTPFVQPFDSGFAQNFSSSTCFNFFTNMTETRPFRSCRPMSMLLQSSSAFLSSQSNISLLNELVWGTCNTNTPESECISNMAWFAESLKTQCATELSQNNSLATKTLIGLQTYSIMREAGCLQDPTTNTYCFINAARDTSPSNLYYYNLPLGITLPKSTSPQCTGCLKSLMGVYSTALKNNTAQSKTLPGLLKTYENAAELTLGKCGVGYALTGVSDSGALGDCGVGAGGKLMLTASVVIAAIVHGVLA